MSSCDVDALCRSVADHTYTTAVQTPNASSYVILGTLAILSFSQVPSKLSGFESVALTTRPVTVDEPV